MSYNPYCAHDGCSALTVPGSFHCTTHTPRLITSPPPTAPPPPHATVIDTLRYDERTDAINRLAEAIELTVVGECKQHASPSGLGRWCSRPRGHGGDCDWHEPWMT